MAEFKFKLVHLNNHNYKTWSHVLKHHYINLGYWKVVIEDRKKKGVTDEEWDNINLGTVTMLLLGVDSDQAQHINHLDDASEQWNVLKAIH